jgi:hypothetical protein
MGMKVIDLRPGNFEKACGFFSLFIIHYFFTIVLGAVNTEIKTRITVHAVELHIWHELTRLQH